MTTVSGSAEETKKLAKTFLERLAVETKSGPTIVGLVGDLGAGKTTFMQGVGEFLGVREALVSPTFVIQKNYEVAPGFPWKRLVHIDAYRIEDQQELKAIAFEGYARDASNIIFIEWPMNMGDDFQPDYKIEFKHVNESEREIKI